MIPGICCPAVTINSFVIPGLDPQGLKPGIYWDRSQVPTFVLDL